MTTDRHEKAAGEVLTAKQAPHQPGTAPAFGLRAGRDVSPFSRRPVFPRSLSMRLSSWLRSARSLFVPADNEKGPRPTRLRKRIPPARARLTIEALEERTVPSTFTVINLADSGTGSLRQAVLDANANPGADL